MRLWMSCVELRCLQSWTADLDIIRSRSRREMSSKQRFRRMMTVMCLKGCFELISKIGQGAYHQRMWWSWHWDSVSTSLVGWQWKASSKCNLQYPSLDSRMWWSWHWDNVSTSLVGWPSSWTSTRARWGPTLSLRDGWWPSRWLHTPSPASRVGTKASPWTSIFEVPKEEKEVSTARVVHGTIEHVAHAGSWNRDSTPTAMEKTSQRSKSDDYEWAGPWDLTTCIFSSFCKTTSLVLRISCFP